MSRYRKVEVKTYGDEKFRKLSPIPPCGQGLWLYLITGPHTTSVPGLFRAGRAALAEELGWQQEAFDKAFAEVFQQGMAKADWSNRVVWIPNAIRHNEPASPNVVKSWANELDLIPECELKAEAVAGIGEALATMNPAYSEAFRSLQQPPMPSAKPSRKASAKASPKTMPNQEQEQQQEQQQEQEKQETLALTALAVPAAAPFITMPLNTGSEFPISEEQVSEWQTLYPASDVRQELRSYRGWAVATPTRRKTRTGILKSVNAWLAKSHNKNSNSNRTNGGSNGTDRKPHTIPALERQRVSQESIRDAGLSRYGIDVATAHGANAESVQERMPPAGDTRDVPVGMGAAGGAARAGEVQGRVIEGHR